MSKLHFLLMYCAQLGLLQGTVLRNDYKYTVSIDDMTISDKFIYLSWEYKTNDGSGDKPDYYNVVTKQSNSMKLESLPSEPNINLPLDSAKQYEITIEAKENGVSNQISNKHTETICTKLQPVERLHASSLCGERFLNWKYSHLNEANNAIFNITCGDDYTNTTAANTIRVTAWLESNSNYICSIQVAGVIAGCDVLSETAYLPVDFTSESSEDCPALRDVQDDLDYMTNNVIGVSVGLGISGLIIIGLIVYVFKSR